MMATKIEQIGFPSDIAAEKKKSLWTDVALFLGTYEMEMCSAFWIQTALITKYK